MTSTYAAQARTALSPEWDHGFDEAFTDLVTNDPDWVRDEFDALIGANFTEPPQPPAPPAPSTDQPQPPPEPADHDQTPSNRPDGSIPADPQSTQRSPP